MSKFWWRSFFFFIVVINVHLSITIIINSFDMYQIQFSPRGDIFVSYCPYCLKEKRSNQNAIS